jgi:hypothetical protein
MQQHMHPSGTITDLQKSRSEDSYPENTYAMEVIATNAGHQQGDEENEEHLNIMYADKSTYEKLQLAAAEAATAAAGIPSYYDSIDRYDAKVNIEMRYCHRGDENPIAVEVDDTPSVQPEEPNGESFSPHDDPFSEKRLNQQDNPNQLLIPPESTLFSDRIRNGGSGVRMEQSCNRILLEASSKQIIDACTASPSSLVSSPTTQEQNVEISSSSSIENNISTIRPRSLPKMIQNGDTKWFMGCVPLGIEDDKFWLLPFQIFLRSQVLEVFSATKADLSTLAKTKRTKSVAYGQVGIRCMHCRSTLYLPIEMNKQSNSHLSVFSLHLFWAHTSTVQKMMRQQ